MFTDAELVVIATTLLKSAVDQLHENVPEIPKEAEELLKLSEKVVNAIGDKEDIMIKGSLVLYKLLNQSIQTIKNELQG